MSTPRTQRGSIARRMWMVTRENGAYVSVGKTQRECGYSDAYPVAVLDLRPEAVEKMVEAAAKRCFEVGFGSGEVWEGASPMMRIAARIEAEAALADILPLRRGRGGK